MKNHFFTGLLSALLFGLSTPLSKMLVQGTSPLALAGIYYFSTALAVLPFIFRNLPSEIQKLKKSKKDLWMLSGSLLFGGILAPIFLLYGLKLTSATSASLLMNVEPVATRLIAYFLFKEIIHRKDWLGALGIVLAGILLIFEKNWIPSLGGVFIILSTFGWGFDNNFTANIRAITPVTNTFFKGLAGGLCNLTLAFFLKNNFPPTLYDFLGAIYVGTFCYGASILLYTICARRVGAFKSQMIFASSPFWGVGLSLLLLKEHFSLQQALATFLLIGSLGLIFGPLGIFGIRGKSL